LAFVPQYPLQWVPQAKILEAFRTVMGDPKWSMLRSLFNKELDEDVREKMKSTRWLEKKGITDAAARAKEVARIDAVKPEGSWLLNKEFFAPGNDAFTDEEKGPKVKYMASQITFGTPLYINGVRYADADAKKAGEPSQKDYKIAFLKDIKKHAEENFKQESIGFKI